MSITLNTKVYNFAQFDQNGASRYLETAGGFPTSFSPLTAKVYNESTGKSRKMKWRLALPIVALVDSAQYFAGEVIETDYFTIEVEQSASGALATRQDLRLRAAGLISNAQFIASWDNFVQPTS